MFIALRHPVTYLRLFIPAFREALSEIAHPSVEIDPIPSPEITACMQKIQLCSMRLMTGFGDPDHCYLPTEVKLGSVAIICRRHIDEARSLGVIETELV